MGRVVSLLELRCVGVLLSEETKPTVLVSFPAWMKAVAQKMELCQIKLKLKRAFTMLVEQWYSFMKIV